MADSVKLANMVRLLAIVHIIVGFLLICFGIADRVVEYRDSWTGYWYYGIWMGIWVSTQYNLENYGIIQHEIMHKLRYC